MVAVSGVGLANVLVVHQLADFDAVGDAGSEARARASALLALTSTPMIYRQRAELDRDRAARHLQNPESCTWSEMRQGPTGFDVECSTPQSRVG